MTVIARGDLTRKVNAGEVTTISGVFLPTPFTGVRAIRAGLIADTYLEAMELELEKKSYDVSAGPLSYIFIFSLLVSTKIYRTNMLT